MQLTTANNDITSTTSSNNILSSGYNKWSLKVLTLPDKKVTNTINSSTRNL